LVGFGKLTATPWGKNWFFGLKKILGLHPVKVVGKHGPNNKSTAVGGQTPPKNKRVEKKKNFGNFLQRGAKKRGHQPPGLGKRGPPLEVKRGKQPILSKVETVFGKKKAGCRGGATPGGVWVVVLETVQVKGRGRPRGWGEKKTNPNPEKQFRSPHAKKAPPPPRVGGLLGNTKGGGPTPKTQKNFGGGARKREVEKLRFFS